jgi:alkaline phosphatase D
MAYTPSRRTLLGGLVAAPFVLSVRARAELAFTDFPFALGVAAGDMTSDGFILWTRLAPRPLEPHGGMPTKPVTVEWEVAADSRFRQMVAKGSGTAWPELAHSVHVDVTGLKPASRYFYRFRCAGETSIVGTVQTLPPAGTSIERVRFAAVGCQHFEEGWYTAYRDVARQPLDFIFHYGDYIYEEHDSRPRGLDGRPVAPVRRYSGPSPFSIDDYRVRYAETKLDADLQAAHTSAGWYCTYDDHEVQNNWASAWDQDGDPPEIFVYRRQAALQAWYEHMPVRGKPSIDGPIDFRRRVDYGGLARFHYPNTRLYRSDQPCGDGFKPDCPDRHAPGLDMLNAAQWSWLDEGFQSSRQRWNLVPQQVMVAMPDRRGAEQTETIYNMDSWGGYPAAQAHLLDIFARHAPGNIVVVTGDEHRHYANDLIRKDRVVASEFVSTSITSQGDGAVDSDPQAILAHNGFVKWINDKRGYVLTEITPDACIGDYRVVEAVTRPDMPVTTAARWGVEAGKAGLVKA